MNRTLPAYQVNLATQVNIGIINSLEPDEARKYPQDDG